MTGMKIPVFERGSILTYDMLEQLKDYFMQAVTIPYAEYSDGILCGCRITMSNGIVQLGQGLICFQGKLLAVTDDLQVQVEPSNARQILILNIGSSYRDVNFEVIDVQLECIPETELSANQLELCRFRLQHGASLRNHYKDFFDMGTEYDTVDETFAHWASLSGETVSVCILQNFADSMLNIHAGNALDVDFVGKILMLEGRSMNRKAVLYYLANRLENPYREMSSHEMYMGLCEVIRRQRGGGGMRNAPRENRRIIVD